jgi:acetyl esterase
VAIHPDARKILQLVAAAARPEYWQLSAAQAKADHEKAFPVMDIGRIGLERVENHTIQTPQAPRRSLPIRLFWPDKAQGEQDPVTEPGAMLWIHGGGHVVGSIDCYDAVCRSLAQKSGHVVAALGYRLAPEHKFPAAVDDVMAGLAWLRGKASEFGIDARRLMVGGDSAGGNLAAVSAILARDTAMDALRHQLLIYPVTAPRPSALSHQQYGEGHLLTTKNIEWFQASYLSQPQDRDDFRFAPLVCPNLEGLASATVIVAECDPLHDEGLAYAAALKAAGNEVDVFDYAGMLHGFFNMGGWLEDSRTALDQCAAIMAVRLA